MSGLTPDEWAELMEEEENHGRSRGEEGGWHSLDYAAGSALDEHYQYIVHVPIHGTRTTYVHESCRCKPCVRANREYHRKRASGKVQESNQEEG